MSKHKEKTPLADWEVTLADSKDPVTVPASWWRVKGGHYRFYGETGVVHDFAPWTVTHVRRVPPVVHHLAWGPDGNGNAWAARCACGTVFSDTAAADAHVEAGGYSEAAQ